MNEAGEMAPASGPTIADESAPLCRCGCGQPVAIRKGKSNLYLHGHNPRGERLSAETRQRMSEAQTERHRRADEELKRLNDAGYLNLRQVAALRSVRPHTVSRWVSAGYLRAEPHVALRPLLLVHRDELKRFNADQWPRLRQRATVLPHFSPLSQQRAAGRKNGSKGGKPRSYTPLQGKAVRALHRDEGLGYKRLSERTGLSIKTIRDILSEPDPKLCECGCGQPAPIAKGTDRRHGSVKGQPVRFIRGHNNRRG